MARYMLALVIIHWREVTMLLDARKFIAQNQSGNTQQVALVVAVDITILQHSGVLHSSYLHVCPDADKRRRAI